MGPEFLVKEKSATSGPDPSLTISDSGQTLLQPHGGCFVEVGVVPLALGQN
jgi:hypothetical protein